MQRTFDLLGNEDIERSNSPLLATLYGFRENLKRKLGVPHTALIVHDDIKGAIKGLFGTSSEPYIYFRFPTITVNTERFNLKQMGRVAIGHTIDDMYNAIATKEFSFPVDLNISCTYKTKDFISAVNFVQNLIIIGSLKKLDFQVNIPNMMPWNVQHTLEGDVTFPDAVELEDESGGPSFEIPFTIKVSTFMSIVKDVPKLNNEGNITINTSAKGG